MTALTSGKTRKKSTITNGVYWPYMVPGLIAFTLIVIVSFVWNIYLSFTKWNGLGAPKWIGFENYAKLMVDETFWQSFLHSVVFIFCDGDCPHCFGSDHRLRPF